MDSLLDTDLDVICELSAKNHFDFVIIGSGIGGGIVARKLVEAEKKVLVLEKGGLLFSSHCLNTSRPHWQRGDIKGPSQDNDVVYSTVKNKIHVAEGSDPYVGGPVYCLGGRSTVWGLFSPELDKDTLDEYFPKLDANKERIDWKAWYSKVLDLFCGYTTSYPCVPGAQDTEVEDNEVQEKINWMEQALKVTPGVAPLTPVELAKMAAEFIAENWYTIPQGAFSTVDYLLDKLYGKSEFLTVVLNADVLYMQTKALHNRSQPQDGNAKLISDTSNEDSATQDETPSHTVEGVVFRDKRGEIRRVQAKRAVVLCAGTIGSAKIALSSNLHQYNPQVGTGLTDHEIWGIRLKTHRKIRESEQLLKLRKEGTAKKRKLSDSTSSEPLNGDDDFARAEAEKAAKQPFKLQCMVDVHRQPALLNICVNADAFLGRGSAVLEGNTHHFGAATRSDKTNTLNITLQYKAKLDSRNKVRNVPTRDPVIEIKREGIYGNINEFEDRKIWQTAMFNLAVNIVENFTSDPDSPTSTLAQSESRVTPTLKDHAGDDAMFLKRAEFGVVAHEVGTLRMQTEKEEPWVVDKDLKFKDVNNLFVCDLSVFPVSPPANPTPTLAALALRLADHLRIRAI